MKINNCHANGKINECARLTRRAYIMHIYIKNSRSSSRAQRVFSAVSLLTLISWLRGFISHRSGTNRRVSTHRREQYENYPAFIITIHAFLNKCGLQEAESGLWGLFPAGSALPFPNRKCWTDELLQLRSGTWIPSLSFAQRRVIPVKKVTKYSTTGVFFVK